MNLKWPGPLEDDDDMPEGDATTPEPAPADPKPDPPILLDSIPWDGPPFTIDKFALVADYSALGGLNYKTVVLFEDAYNTVLQKMDEDSSQSQAHAEAPPAEEVAAEDTDSEPNFSASCDSLRSLVQMVDEMDARPRRAGPPSADLALKQAQAVAATLCPYAKLDILHVSHFRRARLFSYVLFLMALLGNALPFCPPSDTEEVRSVMKSFHESMSTICDKLGALDSAMGPAPSQHAIVPFRGAYLARPIDLLSQVLQVGSYRAEYKGKGLIGAGPQSLNIAGRKQKPAIVDVEINAQKSLHLKYGAEVEFIGGKITPLDKLVHDAVASIVFYYSKSHDGELPPSFTAMNVWQWMSGPDKEERAEYLDSEIAREKGATTKTLQAITDSIERLRTLSVRIDATGAARVWRRRDNIEVVKDPIFSGAALALESVEYKTGDNTVVRRYIPLNVPLLLRYAEMLGQVAYVPRAALVTAKTVHKGKPKGIESTNLNKAVIVGYVEQRIQQMLQLQTKVKLEAADRTIDLETVWEYGGWTPGSRAAKTRMLKNLTDKLETDTATGRIAGYTVRKTGPRHTADAIIIELCPVDPSETKKPARKKRSSQAQQ